MHALRAQAESTVHTSEMLAALKSIQSIEPGNTASTSSMYSRYIASTLKYLVLQLPPKGICSNSHSPT